MTDVFNRMIELQKGKWLLSSLEDHANAKAGIRMAKKCPYEDLRYLFIIRLAILKESWIWPEAREMAACLKEIENDANDPLAANVREYNASLEVRLGFLDRTVTGVKLALQNAFSYGKLNPVPTEMMSPDQPCFSFDQIFMFKETPVEGQEKTAAVTE